MKASVLGRDWADFREHLQELRVLPWFTMVYHGLPCFTMFYHPALFIFVAILSDDQINSGTQDLADKMQKMEGSASDSNKKHPETTLHNAEE